MSCMNCELKYDKELGWYFETSADLDEFIEELILKALADGI